MMATLQQIKDGLANTILAGMPDDSVFVYADVPNVSQTPGIVIQPAPRDTADFNGAFQRGMVTWQMDVLILVKRSDYSVAQETLTELIDPAQDYSIAKALTNDHSIGLTDGTDAEPSGIRLYGGQLENASIPHVCAVLRVTVRTPGA